MAERSTRPRAALTLDLDDLWAYLRASGDPRWESRPSFLARAVPRILECLADLELRATVFVVGGDAAVAANAALLDRLAAAGHAVASHSWEHHPAFHRLGRARLEADFERAEEALAPWLGSQPRGFRAPSFGLSRALLEVLAARGYAWDSSVLPASTGSLAALWERLRFRRSADEQRERAGAYGGLGMARLPLAPFTWHDDGLCLTELPVSTMPGSRLPVHWTYLNFIADRSPRLADAYLATHLRLALRRDLAPVLLLHATDFLGADDPDAPRFVPGMRRSAAHKLAFVRRTLERYRESFTLLPMNDCFDPGQRQRASVPATFLRDARA